MSKIAVYPGSFDPPHYGHLHVISEARDIFDKVIILISNNPAKKEFLSLDEKYELWQNIVKEDNATNIEICSNEKDLTANWMKDRDLWYMVRGVRNSRDFDEEMTLFSVNHNLFKGLSTIFIPSDQYKSIQISSSIIRELVKYKTDSYILRDYTWKNVIDKLKEKFYD